MPEDHPSRTAPLSSGEIILRLRDLSPDELFQWLGAVIDESSPEAIAFPTLWTRHAALAMLYRDCDRPLQLRFSEAFGRVLEAFESGSPKNAADRSYLLCLLSLAPTVRSERAKKRLLRWLYLELFQDWHEEPFNFHAELILATAAYDTDPEWLEYLSVVLPSRPFFHLVARQAYRALLQTNGTACLKLLPAMLKVLDANEESNRIQFAYLLRLTVERHGLDAFLKSAVDALLKAHLSVSEVAVAVLTSDVFLSEALGEPEQIETWTSSLNIGVWQPAMSQWRSMNEEDAVGTFMNILDLYKDYTIIPQAFVKDVLGVLIFHGRYELLVPKKFGQMKLFFELYYENEEANQPHTAVQAAGGADQEQIH